jgi:hypothetical protein
MDGRKVEVEEDRILMKKVQGERGGRGERW